MILATEIQSEKGKKLQKTANEFIKCNFTVNRENKYEVIFYRHGLQILNYTTGKSVMMKQ